MSLGKGDDSGNRDQRARSDSTRLENSLDWGGNKREISFRDYSKFVSPSTQRRIASSTES